jgi:hypothetical protein
MSQKSSAPTAKPPAEKLVRHTRRVTDLPPVFWTALSLKIPV